MFNDMHRTVCCSGERWGAFIFLYRRSTKEAISTIILANERLQKTRKLQTNLTQKLPRKQAYKNITKPFAHRG